MKKLNPYTHYQNTEEWAIIERLLKDLMANQDIELKTAPEYVIGYIVRELHSIRDLQQHEKVFKNIEKIERSLEKTKRIDSEVYTKWFNRE